MGQFVNSIGSYTQDKAWYHAKIKNEGLGASSRNNVDNNFCNSGVSYRVGVIGADSKNHPDNNSFKGKKVSCKTEGQGYSTTATSSNVNSTSVTSTTNTTVSNTYDTSGCLPLPLRHGQGFELFYDDMCDYFAKIHSGVAKLDPEELMEHLNRGFEIYKQGAIEAGLTDGNSELYDAYIIEHVLWAVQYGNRVSAYGRQWREGLAITGQEPPATHIAYFNAKFYFSEREAFESIIDISKKFAEEHNLPDPTLSESLHKDIFFNDTLKYFADEFDLPKDFVPPNRDFYILFDRATDYIRISGKTIRSAGYSNITSQKELDEYLTSKGIDVVLLKFASKVLTGSSDRIFIDDKIQEVFDKLIDAMTIQKTKIKVVAEYYKNRTESI